MDGRAWKQSHLEQESVLDSQGYPEVEHLLAAERREDLAAELVRPGTCSLAARNAEHPVLTSR